MATNDFTLEVTLKQHTPIIHFQHDQEGATLRATEVKPKLDKFIYVNFDLFFAGRQEFDGLRAAFNPEKTDPSPYKIKIYQSSKPSRILIASRLNDGQKKALRGKMPFIENVAFFAEEENIGKLFVKDEKDKKLFHYEKDAENKISKYGLLLGDNDRIQISFFSFNPKVVGILRQIIPYFFAYESFGTRQNKGFGCFSVASIDGEAYEANFRVLLKDLFDFKYFKTIEGVNGGALFTIQRLLTQINEDYKLLKSGNNFGQYKKSLLFLYGVEKLTPPVRWEKRKIKQAIREELVDNKDLFAQTDNSSIADKNGSQSWTEEPSFNYRYLRMALGMAEQYQFITKFEGRNGQPEKDFNNVYIVKTKSENKTIERYRSPIQFKVFDGTIYLLANNLDEGTLNSLKKAMLDFDLYFKAKSEKKPRLIRALFQLGYPENFRIGDFLEFALVKADKKDRVTGYQSF
ncbi:MAG: hypothetical protein KIPDCIKN_02464 [Haliscomenobacter sp.]|jgi:hypothetical protein|nr:hypothetical protein [Haliscomenobacter sp.]